MDTKNQGSLYRCSKKGVWTKRLATAMRTSAIAVEAKSAPVTATAVTMGVAYAKTNSRVVTALAVLGKTTVLNL